MTTEHQLFATDVSPDWEGLVRCIRRLGTPSRVHHIELFLDAEVQTAICERFGLLGDLDPGDQFYDQRRQIIIQRFLGYDYVRCGLEGRSFMVRAATIGNGGLKGNDRVSAAM